MQSPIHFNATVLADAQENDAVDGALHGKIKIALRELGIAQRQIARQIGAPILNLAQECVVNLGSPTFGLCRFRELIE